MKPKTVERATAIKLRTEDKLSVPEIMALLGVSKASLSTWLRPYPLPEECLRERRSVNGHRSSFSKTAKSHEAPLFSPSLQSSTAYRGAYAVSKVEQRALEKGFQVSRPIVDCAYDLIIDDHERLLRVQVKYADGKPTKGSSGSVGVAIERRCRGSKRKDQPYSGQDIDLVLVYVPKRDCIVAIGPEIFEKKTKLCLRYSPPRNGVTKGIHLVESMIW